MARQEQDTINWQASGLPLGAAGLDLRQPSDPRSLAKLLNARFRDERTVERRQGYLATAIRDSGGYPLFLDENDNPVSTPIAPQGWMYGHGQLQKRAVVTSEADHLPGPGIARGVFELDDTKIVWTGDRLLIQRDDGYNALGASAFWGPDNETDPVSYGLPAYLPVQTEEALPGAVDGKYTDTCLTETVRITAATTGGDSITIWVVDRSTGGLIDTTVFTGTVGGTVVGTDPADLKLVVSGAYPTLVWRNPTSGSMFVSYWSGVAWSTPSMVADDVKALDVAKVSGGFYLLWRVENGVDDGIYIGKYSGHTTQSTPFPFATLVDTGATTPDGPVAFAVAPNENVCVVYQAAGLYSLIASPSMNVPAQVLVDAGATWDGGLTVVSRRLSRTQGFEALHYVFVAYASASDADEFATYVYEIGNSSKSDVRHNTRIASKAFRVGNEAFCWLHATNADTKYLVAGAFQLQVSGIADREEAAFSASADGVQGLPSVNPDPLDEHRFTWARPYNTGQDYDRPGNARVGDLNFLPQFSAVQYGKSVYLAGSHVRNWDGTKLGDAGFHDYPFIHPSGFSETTGGGLTLLGAYQFRAYLVRYNKRGERFQSAAVTTSKSLTGSNNKLNIDINTVPLTNHDDCMIELYRTEAGGTTFYLEGSIANDFASHTVTFASHMSDVDLIDQPADSHETGVGGIDEVEEFGPTGCSMLAVSEDRLWGAGGQVPRGWIQFGKLKEQQEGAGFDTLAGFQEIDLQGGEIASIFAYADGTYVMERDQLYLITGSGPNNYGAGSFGVPTLRLADGATTHLGTMVTPVGPVFWGVDGPRLLNPSNTVTNISLPIRELTKGMTPSGVQLDISRQEVVWFTEQGDAVLWNYANGSRWAQWKGLKIAAACSSALVTTDGKLFVESADAYGDGGVPFEFTGSSGELNAGSYGAEMELGVVGIVGAYLGSHGLRFRVFYNGSPLWSTQWTWLPEEKTWLTSGADLENLTPEEIDDLNPTVRSGTYATHKKVSRHSCRHFRVEWSDVSAWRPTYRPYELSLEVGSRGGLGRVAVNSFGS